MQIVVILLLNRQIGQTMDITQKMIKVKELYEGYINNEEAGVRGYYNNLDIRPKFQREFVYQERQRNEVIRTIMNEFPLNVMYWVDRGEEFDNNPKEARYEVLDGQQRTISICEYLEGNYSVDDKYFHNLASDKKEQILNYELFVYVCKGSDSEKLDWFRIINIAGEKLTEQELRNAIYAGSWVSSAKSYFSKTSCPAYNIASDYLKGSTIRQEYLETAIGWAAQKEGISINEFMAQHQHDPTAQALWSYFHNVIDWVEATFPNKRKKEMKGLPWGIYYNQNYKRTDLFPDELEKKIKQLMEDEDVTKKSGIYEYVLDNNEKHLSIRAFNEREKRSAYERQHGECIKCKKHFAIEKMQADHIKPWSKGGKTVPENCQMLCTNCNRIKSNI